MLWVFYLLIFTNTCYRFYMHLYFALSFVGVLSSLLYSTKCLSLTTLLWYATIYADGAEVSYDIPAEAVDATKNKEMVEPWIYESNGSSYLNNLISDNWNFCDNLKYQNYVFSKTVKKSKRLNG